MHIKNSTLWTDDQVLFTTLMNLMVMAEKGAAGRSLYTAMAVGMPSSKISPWYPIFGGLWEAEFDDSCLASSIMISISRQAKLQNDSSPLQDIKEANDQIISNKETASNNIGDTTQINLPIYVNIFTLFEFLVAMVADT